MQAGRELDALVAEKVMGWRGFSHAGPGLPASFWTDPSNVMYGPGEFPHYSTSIADAWQVVEKLKLQGNGDEGWFFVLHYDNAEIWDAQFYKESRSDGGMYQEEKWGCAPTAPLAICLAALKAVGGEEGVWVLE